MVAQVTKVTSGYRFVVVYSLASNGGGMAAAGAVEKTSFVTRLSRAMRTDELPTALLLHHQYTPDSLARGKNGKAAQFVVRAPICRLRTSGMDCLKGVDRIAGEAIMAANALLPAGSQYALHFAQVLAHNLHCG